jgi:hypothetical protein
MSAARSSSSNFNATTIDDDVTFVDEPKPVEEKSLLDSLRNELQREIRNEPINLNVPNRPEMVIQFDTNIEAGTLNMWRKQCQNKSMTDNFDGLKFSSIVVANQAREIRFKNEIIVDEAGELLNFRNPNFLDMLGVTKASDGVRKLYGVDGHIFMAADEIIRASGYDSEGTDQQADPTLLT